MIPQSDRTPDLSLSPSAGQIILLRFTARISKEAAAAGQKKKCKKLNEKVEK
jgi:hypothetical protein